MKPLFDHTEIAAWADQQDPDEEYKYKDNGNCALCQYLRFKGVSFDWVGGLSWHDSTGKKRLLDVKLKNDLCGFPRTFGALVDRLRAAD